MHLLKARLVWLVLLLLAVVGAMPFSGPLFHAAFPQLDRPLYTRASFAELTLAHLVIVATGTLTAALIGIAVGIGVTRKSGRSALPLVSAVAAIGQTFPPVAVLALTIPILGYGNEPTLVALFIYALMPILAATLAGFDALPRAPLEAATALGFSSRRRLIEVELPLAAPVIIAGLRIAAIVNVGTATIGSTVGALTLGSPIIEGLSGNNTAYVIQGAILVALLAVTVDQTFETLARWATRRWPQGLS